MCAIRRRCASRVILGVMLKRPPLGASVALVLVLGSCSAGGTNHTTSPTTTRGSRQQLPPVAVTTTCEQAMVVVAIESAQTDDATTFAHQKTTLHACHSRAEWLAAAARHSSSGGKYTRSGVGLCAICDGEQPEHALSRWCQDQSEPTCK